MPDTAASDRIRTIYDRLIAEYPETKTLLTHRDRFELLIAVILSAQTTDAQVNRVTPALFEAYPNPRALAEARQGDVEGLIHSIGFYRVKANSIRETARRIYDDLGGDVPRDMDTLLTLPGVGRKTANVIRAQLDRAPAIIVDTHFGRVGRRLGLTAQTDPAKVESELVEIVPTELQARFSMILNFHGRYTCKARRPACVRCCLADLCPSALLPATEKQPVEAAEGSARTSTGAMGSPSTERPAGAAGPATAESGKAVQKHRREETAAS